MLNLVLPGVLSGLLAFTATAMLLSRDLPGDTASPELAGILVACAIVMTITGVGLATGQPWSSRLSLVVGLAGVIAGFGGLLLLIGSSLLAVGMFPVGLLDPLSLTILLVLGLTGLTGTGLLRRADAATTADAGVWLVRSWHPVTAGIAIGIAAAWIWSSFIWPLIPHECCLA